MFLRDLKSQEEKNGNRQLWIFFNYHVFEAKVQTTSLIYRIYCNTMTCPYIHHTPHCGTGGGGVMEPLLPRVFDVLQYFEMILLLVESLWSS